MFGHLVAAGFGPQDRLARQAASDRDEPTSIGNRSGMEAWPFEELEDRVMLTLLGQQLFPANYPWNQNIANAPVAANSAAIIAHIGSSIGIHPDWGEDSATQRQTARSTASRTTSFTATRPPRSTSSSTTIRAKATSCRCRFRRTPSSRAITRTDRIRTAAATTAASAAIRT